jgi:hypothetical protein
MPGINSVRESFGFLFDEFEYEILNTTEFGSYGNWLVVLAAPASGRMLVLQDRGEIIVASAPPALGASATDGPWFDLAVVLEYLSSGEQRLSSMSGDPDTQLASWAAALLPHMAEISRLFGTELFETAQVDLDRIGDRRENELNSQDEESRGYDGTP